MIDVGVDSRLVMSDIAWRLWQAKPYVQQELQNIASPCRTINVCAFVSMRNVIVTPPRARFQLTLRTSAALLYHLCRNLASCQQSIISSIDIELHFQAFIVIMLRTMFVRNTRLFSAQARLQNKVTEAVTDNVKATLKAVDRSVSDTIVAGIDKTGSCPLAR